MRCWLRPRSCIERYFPSTRIKSMMFAQRSVALWNRKPAGRKELTRTDHEWLCCKASNNGAHPGIAFRAADLPCQSLDPIANRLRSGRDYQKKKSHGSLYPITSPITKSLAHGVSQLVSAATKAMHAMNLQHLPQCRTHCRQAQQLQKLTTTLLDILLQQESLQQLRYHPPRA